MRRVLFSCLVVAAAFGCQSAPSTNPTEREVRIYPGFGSYSRVVTTKSREAQRWFDQGMQLLYGFNHDEAIRSFEKATQIDDSCAMAWWGVAYGNGLHINNPEMTEHQSREGYRAAQEALKRMGSATPVEQALIRAVSVRYAMPIPKDRSSLDRAYATEMEKAWKAFPNDPDVGALFVESLMNLQPWDLWTHEGQPKGRAEEIVALLERVLLLDPNHPGANHFYIHAVEASLTPERAVAAATRLETLVPGSGHLVHMPSHIWIRTGQYARAADCNARAIEVDRTYFKLAPRPKFYGLYYSHNLHFLAYAAMMEGRYETALGAAADLENEIPPAFLEEYVKLADAFMPTKLHVMIRFGKWREILCEPAPPAHRLVSCAMHHYARGVALAAIGRPLDARRELSLFDEIAKGIDETWFVGNNTAPEVLAISRNMMEGEILYREGAHDVAFEKLRLAIEGEDGLRYDEPPGWMQPVRHALGALLAEQGRLDEAEAVYRADLKRHPGNGWSLLGLEQVLRTKGGAEHARELARISAERTRVWRRADVKPPASCYCAAGISEG